MDFPAKTMVFPLFFDPWGRSSIGRAPALQAGGCRFDADRLHHSFL